MKVLLATKKPFVFKAVSEIQHIIETAGHQFDKIEKYTEKSQLLDAIKDADAVIVRSDIIDREVIDAAPRLKLIVRAGAGYDNVDLNAATERDICVMNTPGQKCQCRCRTCFWNAYLRFAELFRWIYRDGTQR